MRNKLITLAVAALYLIAPPIGAQSPAEQKTPPVAVPQPQAPEPATKPQAPPQAEPAKPPAPPPNKADAAAGEKEEAPDAKAPKRFIPSQRTPADNSASFPVDI